MTPDKMPAPRKLKGLMLRLPFMITCEEFEDFIISYFEGELSRGQRIIFDVHLKVCKECREYLKAYRASMDVSKGALIGSETETLNDVPEDLVEAVIAAREW